MKFPKFFAGLLIGVIGGLLFWYWQKSTSADEGALATLDRLAASELKVRDLEARLRLAEKSKPSSEQTEVLAGLSDLWGLDTPQDSSQEPPTIVKTPEKNHEELVQDDLQAINGIGPAFERRLQEAGIVTYAEMAQQTPDRLRQITGLKSWHGADPQQWIDEAQSRLQG